MKNTYWSCLRLLVLAAAALAARNMGANPEVPVVHILATDPCAAEGAGDTATFTVVRSGPTNLALTVHYSLAGNAVNGVDYLELSGDVEIPSGASSAPITVAPIDDSLVEGGETVAVFLEQPPVLPPPYIVCWPSFAVGHIEDNELAPTNRPPLVRLVNPPDGSVFFSPLDLRLVARASDLDGHVRAVEFFDGTNSLGVVPARPRIIRAIPLADDALELAVDADPEAYPELDPGLVIDPLIIPPDTFTLVWRDVPPGGHVLTAVATDNAGTSTRSESVHIRVAERPLQPIVNVRATDPIAAEPDPTSARLNTATFTVHRSGSTDLPLVVYYRLGGPAGNGVDYAELPFDVTIPRGASTAEVVIKPLDDNLVEGTEGVTLQLVPPVCIAIFPPPPDCYLVGPYDSARAIIQDNDPTPNEPPLVELVRPTDGSVFLAPADITLVAAARDPDGRVVTVEFFAGTNSLGIVTNRPDLLTKVLPEFALKWSNVPAGSYLLTAQATDNDGAVSRSKPVESKVVERTLPPVVSIEATDAEAAETAAGTIPNPAVFTVKRTGPTDRTLLVFYQLSGTASNGVDYAELSGHLTIPNGEASAPLVVEPLDDRLVEGAEAVGVTLVPCPFLLDVAPATAGLTPIDVDPIFPISCYMIGTNDSARAVIRDNDVSPTNTPPKVAIVRPNDGDIFAAPASIRLCAEARDAEGFVRTVEFFAGTNSLGIVTNGPTTVGATLLPDALFCLPWVDVPAGLYVLTAQATDNRGLSSVSDPVRLRVIADHTQPVVTLEATDPFGAEGDLIRDPVALADGTMAFIGPPILTRPDFAIFTVRRDRGTNLPLTVFFDLGGTARNGVDYLQVGRQVTIPAGSFEAVIVIQPIDDLIVEGTESVVAELSPIGCPAIFPPSPSCYLVGEPSKAVAWIRDHDFENRPPNVAIKKPEAGAVFLAPADIDILVLVSDPDGYVTTVEFYAGTNLIGSETRQYFVAPPPGEVHQFTMTWHDVPPGRYELTAVAIDDQGKSTRSSPVPIHVIVPGTVPVVTLTAIDHDATERDPRLAIAIAEALGMVRVTRDCKTNEDLTVRYEVGGNALNGEDYAKLSGTVVIPAGSESAHIFVVPLDDTLVEGDERVTFKLLPSDCAATDPVRDGCYLVGSPASDFVVIHDNESAPPRVAIVDPESGDRFRLGASIPVVAQTVAPDGWVGRMEFFDGTNRIGVEEIVFIVAPPPGQLQRFSMLWSNAPAGRHVLTAKATDDQGNSTISAPVPIEVVDGTTPPVVNIFATDALAREGAGTNRAIFRIRRSGETNTALTVHYAIRGTASNGLDYVQIPSSAIIPAGRHTTRLEIVPLDDRLPEPIETVILRLEESDLYNVGRWGRAGAIIVDNDGVRPGTLCLPDHNFHLRSAAVLLPWYRIEVSDDLVKWEATEANAMTEGEIHFVDPEASELTRRFYRVRPAAEIEVLGADE
jgi:hypothetical protein